MQKIAVYRFRYFDLASRRFQMSQNFATELAIAHVGGRLLPETERLVPHELVGENGYLTQALSQGVSQGLPLPQHEQRKTASR